MPLEQVGMVKSWMWRSTDSGIMNEKNKKE